MCWVCAFLFGEITDNTHICAPKIEPDVTYL